MRQRRFKEVEEELEVVKVIAGQLEDLNSVRQTKRTRISVCRSSIESSEELNQ